MPFKNIFDAVSRCWAVPNARDARSAETLADGCTRECTLSIAKRGTALYFALGCRECRNIVMERISSVFRLVGFRLFLENTAVRVRFTIKFVLFYRVESIVNLWLYSLSIVCSLVVYQLFCFAVLPVSVAVCLSVRPSACLPVRQNLRAVCSLFGSSDRREIYPQHIYIYNKLYISQLYISIYRNIVI